MNIPWKLKSFLFFCIDFLGADFFLYFIQKHVTKRSRIKTLEIDKIWVSHQMALISNGCTGFIFEFGAGKSLAQNLFLSNTVDRQLVVDLNSMIDIKIVEQARSLLFAKVGLNSKIAINSLSDLRSYGICYKAPYDATKIDLPDKCLDASISTNTLEHIPKDLIKSIFNELHRVLKDNGIVSARIDYSDHYAHTDSTITLLNYLKFSEHEWSWHNHRCHYQNRLRNNDYKIIFAECGFCILSEDLFFDEDHISDDLWRKYKNDEPDWCATSAHFVLKKLHAQ